MVITGLIGCGCACKTAILLVQITNDMNNGPGAAARKAEARRLGAEVAKLDRVMADLDAEFAEITKSFAELDRRHEALKRWRADRDRWVQVPVVMATGNPQLAFGQMATAAAQSDWVRRAMINIRPANSAVRERGARIAEADKRIEEMMRQKANKK